MKAILPNSQDDAFSFWLQFQLEVLLPMGRGGNLDELVQAAENFLKGATDPAFRQLIMGGVSSVLNTNDWEDESLTWCKRAIVESPDDPMAQNALATWYCSNPRREPSQEDLEKALRFSSLAVEKARASDTWRRHVLYDRCRIAARAKRYKVVAESMAEILEVCANPCEPDIPVLERDWLAIVPEGAIDPSLLRRYREAVDQDLKSQRGHNA